MRTERGVQVSFNNMVNQAYTNGVLSVVAAGNGVTNPQTGAFIGPVSQISPPCCLAYAHILLD